MNCSIKENQKQWKYQQCTLLKHNECSTTIWLHNVSNHLMVMLSSLSGCLGDPVRKDWAGRAHCCQTHQWDRSEPQLFSAYIHADTHIQYLNSFLNTYLVCNVAICVFAVLPCLVWIHALFFVLLQWCTLPTPNGSSPTETCQSNSTSGVMSWSVSSYSHMFNSYSTPHTCTSSL